MNPVVVASLGALVLVGSEHTGNERSGPHNPDTGRRRRLLDLIDLGLWRRLRCADERPANPSDDAGGVR